MSLFEELKRRNVFRVGIAYVLLGWVVLQGADFALDLIDAPNWIIQVFFIAGLAGLPIVLFALASINGDTLPPGLGAIAVLAIAPLIPAWWTTSTTRETSLYASGISSANMLRSKPVSSI